MPFFNNKNNINNKRKIQLRTLQETNVYVLLKGKLWVNVHPLVLLLREP